MKEFAAISSDYTIGARIFEQALKHQMEKPERDQGAIDALVSVADQFGYEIFGVESDEDGPVRVDLR